MTARVCPVHGEYAPTGICRWCEPQTLLDVAMSGPKVRPLPVAEPTPWAKKPSGADQSTITLPATCICQKCLLWFQAPIPLTSLLCPACKGEADALKALSAPLYADVPPPEKLSEALVGLSERLPSVPTYMGAPVVVDPHMSADAPPMLVNCESPAPRYPLLNYLPPEYDHTEAVIDAETHAAEKSRLLAQHAALRWERVARRWANKHGPWTLLDFAQHWQFFLNKLVDRSMEILKRNNPLLFEKPKEPKR